MLKVHEIDGPWKSLGVIRSWLLNVLHEQATNKWRCSNKCSEICTIYVNPSSKNDTIEMWRIGLWKSEKWNLLFNLISDQHCTSFSTLQQRSFPQYRSIHLSTIVPCLIHLISWLRDDQLVSIAARCFIIAYKMDRSWPVTRPIHQQFSTASLATSSL